MPSDAAKLVMALAVATAVGVIMIGPVSTVVGDTTGQQTVTNETVIADFNQSADLDGYDIDVNSETVYAPNSSGTYVEATSPDDYTIDYPPGEISFNSSSTLIQEGEEVKVSYTYEAAGATATLVIGFIPLAMGLLIFVAIARATTDYL